MNKTKLSKIQRENKMCKLHNTIIKYLINQKLTHDSCELYLVINLINVYKSKSLPINNFLTNFIAFNLLYSMRNSTSFDNFKCHGIPLYCELCNQINQKKSEKLSETISECFEEFKTAIFHKRFDNSDELNFDIDDYILIYQAHVKLGKYVDKAFLNYLSESIKITQQLSFIS